MHLRHTHGARAHRFQFRRFRFNHKSNIIIYLSFIYDYYFFLAAQTKTFFLSQTRRQHATLSIRKLWCDSNSREHQPYSNWPLSCVFAARLLYQQRRAISWRVILQTSHINSPIERTHNGFRWIDVDLFFSFFDWCLRRSGEKRRRTTNHAL